MIKNFRFNVQTCVYFGRNSVEEHGDIWTSYGQKAGIVTSKFAEGSRNIALEDVTKSLETQGIAYQIYDDTQVDPPVENIVDMYRQMEAFSPSFLIGIGGGAALDAAKALAVLMDRKGEDPYQVFFGTDEPVNNFKNDCSIPVFEIPTTAGTGSEITGGAVLCREDKDTKEAMYMWLYPEASFVDPRYIEDSPQWLLDTGITDALCHGIESSLHAGDHLHDGANPISCGMANMGFEMFATFKDNLLANSLTKDDFDAIHLASLAQGTAFMHSCTTIPHGLSYPLSCHKGVPHGLACALTVGAYLEGFKDQALVKPIVSRCGFDSPKEFTEYMQKLVARSVELVVTDEEIEAWSEEFMHHQPWRIEANPEPITVEDIKKIYDASLAPYRKA